MLGDENLSETGLFPMSRMDTSATIPIPNEWLIRYSPDPPDSHRKKFTPTRTSPKNLQRRRIIQSMNGCEIAEVIHLSLKGNCWRVLVQLVLA